MFAEKVPNRGLCAAAMCEQLRYKLCGGLPIRRACYGVLRFIMESEATGCEVIVSGKIRGQRAKTMKFVDGVMIHSGDAMRYYIDEAIRHVHMKQGGSFISWLSLHWLIIAYYFRGSRYPRQDHAATRQGWEDWTQDGAARQDRSPRAE